MTEVPANSAAETLQPRLPRPRRAGVRRRRALGREPGRPRHLGGVSCRLGTGRRRKPTALPWSRLPRRRVDPTNGLCLSRLHDAAFDRGLITFDEELRLVLSRRLRDHLTSATLSANFLPLAGARLTPPDRFHPSAAFLATHREQTFQGES